MKVTFKTLDGRTMTKEFLTVDEFVMLQNREIPAIDDSAKVLEVVISGQAEEFSRNVADLYFKLSK
ncbi:hypothetical protein [Lactococcus cremoris]|uniref:DUF4649 family protein n=1 Tax=Lactococcus lactis subsp. cremoris (strain MG1363) TaxID=416870 RepID=A2RHG5_LACLM|nr:hypothetical protein [Lactococcus cremoris]ADJ59114.1 hypothetical protein LLNZ_00470 [Lactococcus cremoris subsp. cremoris NZ9000]KZK50054.1 hypothetical protein NCDO763_1911 [Lactococcus cremoris]MCT4435362.1 hypothetical protein [Lactococcus cremoris]MCT4446636.1 hypothetical protein [Lactococcus cremoris]MCZ7689553.1 hypothetical protein [Lactococcus cremoris]